MNEQILSTIKSSETDDWLDTNAVRPTAYHWARFFARYNVHPNTVTIISLFVGAASALFFMRGSYYYEGAMGFCANLIAILLLAIADILDCTDGQLARMTGKTSRLGRILDGTAGIFWYIPIYSMLIYRFYIHHDIEFNLLGISDTPENTCIATLVVFVIAGISGYCLADQCRVADYYIQAHLFFLKGEKGSELESSSHLQQMYDETPWKGNIMWKVFLKSYINYTKLQEKRTPQFQELSGRLKQAYGASENIPQEIRQQFHEHSLPLMKIVPLLTFNFRTAFLILFCLIDIPVAYFLFEIIFMSLMSGYALKRHESFCKEICKQ